MGENSPVGTFIGNPVTAPDADGDKLTYTLTGANTDIFDIDWATGQLMTKMVPQNTEEDANGTNYTVTVRATDPAGIPQADSGEEANSDTVMVTITVTDVDEPPTINGTGDAKLMFDEKARRHHRCAGYVHCDADPEMVALADTAWSVAGPDGGKFTVTVGELKFKVKPDYEMPTDANMDNVYEVTVQISDPTANRGMKMVKVEVVNSQ